MKYLFVYLLIACLASPVWGSEPAVTLEEFVQKLEEAEPWTREKMEALLDMKFTKPPSSAVSSAGALTSYTASGQFVYGKGLIINRIHLYVSASTNKTVSFAVFFDNKSSCFTQKWIEKLYPNGSVKSVDDVEERYYAKKRPWGELSFGFYGWDEGDCLTGIAVITNTLIK
jgi:hypothetical protein